MPLKGGCGKNAFATLMVRRVKKDDSNSIFVAVDEEMQLEGE
jgi:CO dehydrogenase nickel-insertion accessory protein CooC1